MKQDDDIDPEEDSEDFRMTLEEFVRYQQKVLVKFAQYWAAQNGQPPLQEPETWQNLLIDYCDCQFEYDVDSWPLNPPTLTEP